METIRESWTDERMDDFNRHVDQGFERSDAALRDLRSEMREGFKELNLRFDAFQRTMILAAGGVIASLIGLIATQF